MSNTALLERPTTSRHLRAVPPLDARKPRPPPRHLQPLNATSGRKPLRAASRSTSGSTRPRRPHPVWISASWSMSLAGTLAELAPEAETYATVALAPSDRAAATSTSCDSPSTAVCRRTQQDEPEETHRRTSSWTSRASASDRWSVSHVHVQGVRVAPVPRAARRPHDEAHTNWSARSGTVRPK